MQCREKNASDSRSRSARRPCGEDERIREEAFLNECERNPLRQNIRDKNKPILRRSGLLRGAGTEQEESQHGTEHVVEAAGTGNSQVSKVDEILRGTTEGDETVTDSLLLSETQTSEEILTFYPANQDARVDSQNTMSQDENYEGQTFGVSPKKKPSDTISIGQFEALLVSGLGKVVDQIGTAVSQVKENSTAILSNLAEIKEIGNDIKELKGANDGQRIREVVEDVVRQTMPLGNSLPVQTRFKAGATCPEQQEAHIKKYNHARASLRFWPIPGKNETEISCLLYTSPSPRDRQKSRMPSSA